jgi:hypothetical protein
MLGASWVRGFGGYIAEVLVSNRALTVDERDVVGNYLLLKYSLSQYITNAVPPGAPNLVATGLAPGQLNLLWTPSTNAYSYHINRKLGTNGAYEEIASLPTYITNFVDTTASATNTYFYYVRAHNFFGDAYSSVISPPSIGLTNWPSTVFQNSTNWVGAQAAASDGNVSNVQFIANRVLIGAVSSPPYALNWLPTFEGTYLCAALATDSQGNSQYSALVTVTVYLDSNGDGIPDIIQVQNGDDPINPWTPPVGGTNNVPPNIYLQIPTNAVLVP